MSKLKKCAICQREAEKGLIFHGVTCYDRQTPIRKRWKVARKREQIFLCEKCRNTWYALVRNHIALKTNDIVTMNDR